MSEKVKIREIDLYVINQVKMYREKKGISQEALAFHLGVSPGFIGQVESPKYRAKYNLSHLNSAAKLFGCSPRDFLPLEPL
ncbi:MAG: helix-turn-helix transcriptional regulator [Spirosomataceae bacterium]